MTEGDLQAACLQALDRIPDIYVMRLNSGGVKAKGGMWFRGCPAGTPDLLILLPGGSCVWVELKPDKPHHNQKTIATQST